MKRLNKSLFSPIAQSSSHHNASFINGVQALCSNQLSNFSMSSSHSCGFISIMSPHESIASKQEVSIRGSSSSWEERMKKGLQSIRHRGPDSSHIWIDPHRGGKVALAHARLSIIDLKGGDQPLSNHDQTIHVVVNGELYDYERIRSDLMNRCGYTFKTHSDSEIVLALYQEYGLEMFKHLRGEFVFSLWDSKAGIMIVAKDRFGIKPLFYTKDEKSGAVLFASEMKAFFEMGIKCEWDEDSVVYPGSYDQRTLFKNVYQFPPGHYAIIALHDVNMRQLLEESIRHRLKADVPVGVYLSGGIDSCAVLGLSNKILKEHFKSNGSIDAFTLSFKDHVAFDEASIAAKQAQLSGAKYHEIPITQQELADHFEETVYHCERPNIQTSFIAKFLLSRAVRDAGYKVVLTGEGSDETFCGYPWFKIDLLNDSQALAKHDREEIVNLLLEKNIGFRYMFKSFFASSSENSKPDPVKKLVGFHPSFLSVSLASHYDQFLHSHLVPSEEEKEAMLRYRLLNLVDASVTDKMKHKWNNVHSSMYLWAKTLFQNFILVHLGDRCEMAHSVEGRVPFLDHHLVEYVNNLPLSLKLKADLDNKVLVEKYALREATKDVLTEEVYQRIKHPFTSPPSTWNKNGPVYQLFQETLRSSEFDKQPFYDRKKVVQFLDTVHESQDPTTLQAYDGTLTHLTCLAFIQKRFNPSLPSPSTTTRWP
ncbi:hypothetical protein C9374_001894 [Naegleria lovaniensis]|uniref:Glutamine amidotransferase type-2 domain-containing protein n=1 Tax=Naegleria lovaniensis TaxID=51637 RepID=A0AA88KMD5_NAELO|nr:uncharacterized protein C9374_001894 [Naegleria lovaniensis]KAG2386859.1 hypothetical protein C9374_001894 [Naegleria lovaniensis]